MKKTKVVMALACAVLLVGASVMGTLAYLTSTTNQLKNTFTIGENVAITLDETKTDKYGVVETDEEGETTKISEEGKGNQYKLMPGHKYVKDPTVRVTGEDCYVFVVVHNGIEGILADNTINNQITSGYWAKVEAADGETLGNIGDGETLYIYKKTDENGNKTVAEKNDNLVVFSNFTVKDSIENGGFANYASANITIKAYAVQTVDFESKTPAQIWAATFGVVEDAD